MEQTTVVSSSFVIYSETEQLFWSNEMGWVALSDATLFSKAEARKFVHIPKGGRWVIHNQAVRLPQNTD